MPTRLRNVAILAAAVAAAGAAAWYTWSRDTGPAPDPGIGPGAGPVADPPPTPDPPTPDPRLVFPTPFRNVKPHVRYVGDAACADCHAGIDKTYHQHPMGRSAALVGQAAPLEKFDPAARPTFTVGQFEVRVEKTGGGMTHRIRARDSAGEWLPDYVAPADVAIGSGTRGRSYLSVQGGAVWQSPVSWFSPEARWDLSPGFEPGARARRPVVAECLFCHVDRVEPVSGSLNRYREPLFPIQAAVGCERCHGPGELHVNERTHGGPPADGPDTSIVNPKHLPPDLREAICAQCHLQGQERVVRRGRELEEFRPGLPLEQFVSVYVRHPNLAEANRSVGQFEQLEQSRCSAGSGGRLGCTTCHDPHQSPPAATRDEFYRGRCLTCHESRGCSLPRPERAAKQDRCTACHMPRAASSNITHASVTDHRIPRRPTTAAMPRGLSPGTVPLVPFITGRHAPPDEERERDMGVALGRLVVKTSEPGPRAVLSGLAENRLARSLGRWPGDLDARAGLAMARAARGDVAGSLAAATAAVALAPGSEPALDGLAAAAYLAGRYDLTVEAATKVIGLNPTAPEPLVTRAAAYTRLGEWAKAEADCRAALRIHPLHSRARLVLAVCRHRLGDPAGGRREAETAAGLATDPRQRAGLLDWYAGEVR